MAKGKKLLDFLVTRITDWIQEYVKDFISFHSQALLHVLDLCGGRCSLGTFVIKLNSVAFFLNFENY